MDNLKTSPVKIVGQDEPVPVEVVAVQPDPHTATQTTTQYSPPHATVARADDMVASPTTTAEQNLVTQGQRRINLIWEATQAVIAITVTGANIYAALAGKESILLGNAFTLIIAIYFVRQNHIKTGGIGGTDSR
jgi:hypothetical protein